MEESKRSCWNWTEKTTDIRKHRAVSWTALCSTYNCPSREIAGDEGRRRSSWTTNRDLSPSPFPSSPLPSTRPLLLTAGCSLLPFSFLVSLTAFCLCQVSFLYLSVSHSSAPIHFPAVSNIYCHPIFPGLIYAFSGHLFGIFLIFLVFPSLLNRSCYA